MAKKKMINSSSTLLLVLLLIPFPPPCRGNQSALPPPPGHLCDFAVDPPWPFAYAKHPSQSEEGKGRTSANLQDVRHRCGARGVRSKCHVCECDGASSSSSPPGGRGGEPDGNRTAAAAEDGPATEDGPAADGGGDGGAACRLQLQGVAWDDLTWNVPTVTDVPWAVGGRHRYDLGGENTSHVCVYLSGSPPCGSAFGTDYSRCRLRCWGHNGGAGPGGAPSLAAGEGGGNRDSAPRRTPPHPGARREEYPGSEAPANPALLGPYRSNPQGLVFTLAGSGTAGFDDGIGAGASFRDPEGVAVDHLGNVYVADSGNHAVRAVSPLGRVTTIAGTGAAGCDDGTGGGGAGPRRGGEEEEGEERAAFSSPSDVAVWRDWSWWPYPDPVDPDSDLYRNGGGALVLLVADTANHRIRKITAERVERDPETRESAWAGVRVECLAGRCGRTPRPGRADGPGGDASFDAPQGIAVSDGGDVYVADRNNHLVRRVDRHGRVTTVAGRDGEFNYPADVGLEPDGTGLLVVDRHRLHRVDLRDGTSTVLAGGREGGEDDGDGREATYHNPGSVAVTGDGVAYVADVASCRLRRVSRHDALVPRASCGDDLASVNRPRGCSSYGPPADGLGLTSSPVEGNVYHNYLYRNETDDRLGRDHVGRTVRDCVGSPPLSRLDTRRWNGTAEEGGPNLVVDDGRTHVREDPNDGTRIAVTCGGDCPPPPPPVARLPGLGGVYPEDASVCGAALGEGLLDGGGATVHVTIVSETALLGDADGGGRASAGQYFAVSASPGGVRTQTISGAPATLRGQRCGLRDSFPPQAAMFYHPSGLGAYVNATLDDSTRLLYVADRTNNVVRGVSAVCAFPCENGAVCVGPDLCRCEPGWAGPDCTTPVCDGPCPERELCVAPDTCGCVPGYGGDGCLEATCVQDCRNGGRCTSPDTCSCAPGWFDPNCTTPVCEQTCGNGGNCTGPDTCTCPSDFEGFDCRTPVCDQECLNGGWCVAPNTCLCPPGYSSFDCSQPVCTQGFFVPRKDLPGWMLGSVGGEETWLEYRPCNYTEWCAETNGFDCSQLDREASSATPLYGPQWRHKTGRKVRPDDCMMIEIGKDSVSHFQYLSAADNSSTAPHRYSPKSPFGWLSDARQPWNAFDGPGPGLTRPFKHELDRQIALVEYRNVTQGAYMCANLGRCVSPDVCSCAEGWVGFDCRTPVCGQGYFEEDLESFVKGVTSDDELARFDHLLDPRRTYDLDSSRNFSSNGDVLRWTERFVNGSFVERTAAVEKGTRYYTGNGTAPQGGYRCSIRANTEWENYRSGFVSDHPNFYSRYMDEKVEGDGHVYSRWNGMKWPPTHHKTAELVRYDTDYLDHGVTSNISFVYTDVGYMRDGVWTATGAEWMHGICIVEFERHCNGEVVDGPRVQDTDESHRPRIVYNDKSADVAGRLFRSRDDVCVDHVIRGCFNNATCVAPGTCECAQGWTGQDCSVAVCDQPCHHNGNCTNPNTCTCERGWSGVDCSIPLCAQTCAHGGVCVAPDTCQCKQWNNEWRDGRSDGGVPIYQKPNGDPQMTGWTGYDCSTPICVQAERFRLNIGASTSSTRSVNLTVLGGHGGDGKMKCGEARCPMYDQMVTQNDGKSFQSGCGWDILDTGCCFELDNSSYSCWRCENLAFVPNNVTCPDDWLRNWVFHSSADVPLDFKSPVAGEILRCGSDLSPMPQDKFANEMTSQTLTSNIFLCGRSEWIQGDYIDDAGLGQTSGIGTDFGLKPGRHVRVNHNNYQRVAGQQITWIEGPEEPGEGIYECFNSGSCIAPDTCTCKDGYGGHDCSVPLCRHEQASGEVVGCQNGGVCNGKDDCECIMAESILWKVHDDAQRGLTGYQGKDCSIPMCIQGFYDPNCVHSKAARGGEGCYRCANGGTCVGADLCECADGWTGYDCKTPICKAHVTPLIRDQLMTSDKRKLRIFEEDPCGMNGFSSLYNEGPRGVCTLPNQCTCTCYGEYNYELCQKLGGKHCHKPFIDPLFRKRNILSPNEQFGTRGCYSGFEGVVNENDLFSSCHIRIFEPNLYQRHTRLFQCAAVFCVLCVIVFASCCWKYLLRREERRHRQHSMVKKISNHHASNAFAYARKKNQ